MKPYIGTKQITAQPMSRGEYNVYRGWTLPDDENGADAGYLVEYLDGGIGNHPDHKGYISWSPKEQFENAYQSNGDMSFGHALVALKDGKRIARSGWNGKGMWLVHVDPLTRLHPQTPTYDPLGQLTERPWIGMKTVDNQFVPWVASQTDMLADDWCVVGEAGA